jgi:hypothetical protein
MPSSNPDRTPKFALPSPKPSDPPDVPGDMAALTARLEQLLTLASMTRYIDADTGAPKEQWVPVNMVKTDASQTSADAGVLAAAGGGISIVDEGVYAFQFTCQVGLGVNGVLRVVSGADSLSTAPIISQPYGSGTVTGIVRLPAGATIVGQIYIYAASSSNAVLGGRTFTFLRVFELSP